MYAKYKNTANAPGAWRPEQSHQCYHENDLYTMCWTIGNGILDNRDISQIPKCPCHISHNALFWNRNVNTCEHFYDTLVNCGIFVWCVLGFVRRVALSTSKRPEHHALQTCSWSDSLCLRNRFTSAIAILWCLDKVNVQWACFLLHLKNRD